MNAKDDGGPAFPGGLAALNDRLYTSADEQSPGMTLRDWFAGQALQGMLAADYGGSATRLALLAYEQADEMLKAQKEPTA